MQTQIENVRDLLDEQLIVLTAQHDFTAQLAFTEISNRHSDLFFRIAMRIVRDEHDAQDVVQTALMKMYEKAGTFKADGSFGGWSQRVVRNEALMHLRRLKRRGEVDYDAVPESVTQVESTTPADNLVQKQLRELLGEAIEKLEPKYKEPFEMKVFEGLSVAELSVALDLTEGGVKTRLHRARAHLRQALTRKHKAEVGAFLGI